MRGRVKFYSNLFVFRFISFLFLLISSGDDVGEDLVMIPEVKRKLEEGKSLSLIDTDTVTAVTRLILYLFSLLS